MSKMVIVVRKDLNMRKGKLAAQVAHAASAFLINQISAQARTNSHKDSLGCLVLLKKHELQWCGALHTKIVVSVDSKEELEELIKKAKSSSVPIYPIIDAGKTEFAGVPTLTCAAFGPYDDLEIDKITGNLQLM